MPIDLSAYLSEDDTSETPPVDLSSYLDTPTQPVAPTVYESLEPPLTYMDEISGAIATGFKNMRSGLATTGMIAGVVDDDVVVDQFLETIRNQPETPEYYQRFVKLFETAGKNVDDAEGFWDSSIEWFKLMDAILLEAVTNPKATGYVIAESIANSLPALTLAGGGAVGGGAAGGPPGAIAGLVTGTVAGTFVVEAGHHLNQLIQENLAAQNKSFSEVTEEDVVDVLQSDGFLDWAESESVKRGLSVAAVEGIFAMFGGKLLSGARKGVISKVARGAGDVGIETIGEMTGELAGQLATEGDVKAGEIAMEGIAGLGQSAGTTLIGAAARKSKDTLTKTVEDTSQTATPDAEAVPEGDALDQEIANTVKETDQVEGDALDQEIAAASQPAPEEAAPDIVSKQQELQDIIDQSPRLAKKADQLIEEGIFGEDLVSELYIEATGLPESMRSDAHKALIAAYEKTDQEQSIGEKMRVANQRVSPVNTTPQTEFKQKDQLDLLASLDNEFLGDADRVALAPAETETTELSLDEYLSPEKRRELTSFRTRFLEESVTVSETDPRAVEATKVSADGAKVSNIMQKNLSEILPKGSDSVFYQTNLKSAKAIISVMEAGSRKHSDLVVTDNQDLGEGGKGYILEFDPSKINGVEATDVIGEYTVSRSIVGGLRAIIAPNEKGIQALEKNKQIESRFDFDNVQQVSEGIRIERLAVATPVKDMTAADVDAVAARDSATSPYNDIDQPSKEQIEAGTYPKAKVSVLGLPISIESPKDSIRQGTDATGKKWSQKMQDHYGYITGTIGKDKDHIDVFIGPSEQSKTVFVVDQVDPSTKAFDEHKVILGAKNVSEARKIYRRNYAPGWKGMGSITQMKISEFKTWMRDPVLTHKPVAQRKETTTEFEVLASLPGVVSVTDRSVEKGVSGKIRKTTNGVVKDVPVRVQSKAEQSAIVKLALKDSEDTLNVPVKRVDATTWTINYDSVPVLSSPERVTAYTIFTKAFDKIYRKEQPPVLEIKKDSSFQVAMDLGVNELLIKAELETEMLLAEATLKANKNIRNNSAAKKVRVALKLHSDKLKARRASHAMFEKGTDPIDAIADEFLGTSQADETLKEVITRGVKNALGNISVRDHLGLIRSDVRGIEVLETTQFGGRIEGENSPTVLTFAAKNSKVAAAAALNINGIRMHKDGKYAEFDKSIPALADILEPIAAMGTKTRRQFEMWLASDRSARLITEGKEQNITQPKIDIVQKWVEDRPDLKKVFNKAKKDWRRYNKSLLEYAVAAGSVNQEDAFGGYAITSKFRGKQRYHYKADGSLYSSAVEAEEVATDAQEVIFIEGWYQDDYVPYNRVIDGDTKGPSKLAKVGQQYKLIRKLTGGEGKVAIIDNMIANTTSIIHHAMHTIAMNQIVDTFGDTVLTEETMEGPIPLVDSSVLEKALKLVGMDIDTMTEPEVRRWSRLFQGVNPNAVDSVVVFRNGKQKYYRVEDPLLLRALKHVGPKKVSMWLQAVGFPTKVVSWSVTKTLSFMARNVSRDVQALYVIDENGSLNPAKTLASVASNLRKIAKSGSTELQDQMLRGMVSAQSYYSAAPKELLKKLKKSARDPDKLTTKIAATAGSAWDAYNRLGVASEHASRLTIRDNALNAGKSTMEADYLALDFLNHSRRGEGPIIETLVAITPFLNPRIQGNDRLYRGAKVHHSAYVLRALILMGAATALALWNNENREKELDDLTEVEKDSSFNYWIGDYHGTIPKGFEVGQIAGTLPERLIERLYSNDTEAASETIGRFMSATFGLDHGQLYRPVLEVMTGYDTFRERPILGFGDQFKSEDLQYDAWTPEMSKILAKLSPDFFPDKLKSPKMVDHLLKGYFGPMGAAVLDGSDYLWSVTGNAPDAPTKSLGELPLIRSFYRGEIKRSSRHVKRYYQMLEETRTLSADLKVLKDKNTDIWVKRYVENADKIAARGDLNKYDKKMRRLNKQYRETVESMELNGDQKATIMQTITIERNRLASEASKLYWWAFR